MILLLVALAASSFAAPPTTPTGVDKVCAKFVPEPSPEDLLASALKAGSPTVPCDLAAESGLCLFDGRVMAVAPFGAMSAVPFESYDPYEDQIVYIAQSFDLGGAGPRVVDIRVDGMVLAEGLEVDGPVEIVGRVSLVRGRWYHVATVSGKSLSVPVVPNFTPPAEAPLLRLGASPSTRVDIRPQGTVYQVSSKAFEGDKPFTFEAAIEIEYRD